MGRYCGEDYDDLPPCRPGEHNWAMNGTCWKCRATRDQVIADAKQTLAVEQPKASTAE